MTITDPAHLARGLHAAIGRRPWLATVGHDPSGLVVFVHHMPTGPDRELVPETFEGLPVAIRYARNPEGR